ncbi:MAG: endonuclease III [Bacteroidetes bacterium]|nr:endonuclease III [Bacteroidota bacterium]
MLTPSEIKKESYAQKIIRSEKIVKILSKKYKNPSTALTYSNPLQLLISIILSAQCTDERVNLVTPKLFKLFNSIEDFANANKRELEQIIYSTGYYRNKAKNIIACCQSLKLNFNNIIPSTMEELISLPGVGRKTANCLLTEYFNKTEGIVVDTHVLRISNRLGFTKNIYAVKTEIDLMNLIKKKYWRFYGSDLILFGRELCKARSPNCKMCLVSNLCPSRNI